MGGQQTGSHLRHPTAAGREYYRDSRPREGIIATVAHRPPPSVQVNILTDRTETIRASVRDVQFTLLLTVALVVMVIFVFLRKLWATVIPSIALPLAIVGTFGVMHLLGFSLDNFRLWR